MITVVVIMLPFMMSLEGLEYWMILFMLPTIVILIGLNGPMRTGDDKKSIDTLLISMVLGLIGFFLLETMLPYIN